MDTGDSGHTGSRGGVSGSDTNASRDNVSREPAPVTDFNSVAAGRSGASTLSDARGAGSGGGAGAGTGAGTGAGAGAGAVEAAAGPAGAADPGARLRPLLSEMTRALKAGADLGWTNLTRARHVDDHGFMEAQGAIDEAIRHPWAHRYCNILPWDAHRVRLACGAYVNASWVCLREMARQPVIVAQGPMSEPWYTNGRDTTPEFWRMIAAHRVAAIVNLAKVQRGFTGCSGYWPQGGVGASHTYVDHSGVVPATRVTVVAERQVVSGLTRRTLTVCAHTGSAAAGSPPCDGACHTCEQLHFEQWPNYDIAGDMSATQRLLREVETVMSASRPTPAAGIGTDTAGKAGSGGGTAAAAPILVHCSGGVGRSGTMLTALATVHHLWTTANEVPAAAAKASSAPSAPAPLTLKDLPVPAIVQQIRDQRHPWCVEGPEQYNFCLRLIASELAARVASQRQLASARSAAEASS